MSIGVNELFEMISWNSDKEIQKKGIEEGKKVRYISIFMQPTEDKSVWENCAKIIAANSNEIIEKYIYDLFEWLQDANWPGFDIIYNRIKAMPADLIGNSYKNTITKAINQSNEMWIYYLGILGKEANLYDYLSNKEIKTIENCIEEII